MLFVFNHLGDCLKGIIMNLKEKTMKKFCLVLFLFLSFFSIAFGAATDNFKNYRSGLTSPGYSAFEITPSDTNELLFVTRAITCGVDGDLYVEMADGADVTFKGRVAGIDYPYRIRSVYNSTTMTDCVGLY